MRRVRDEHPPSWLAELATPRNYALASLCIIALGWMLGTWRAALRWRHAAGMEFPAPEQTKLDEPLSLPAPEGYTITATDEYEVTALVLARERYRYDRGAVLAPVDLALAWGPVADPDVHTKIRWSQADRWYRFQMRYEDVRMSPIEVSRHSANTHIIPNADDPDVADLLLAIRPGNAVHLKGYLVRIEGDGGYTWNSSRSRTDSGDGSCEIFYVMECELL